MNRSCELDQLEDKMNLNVLPGLQFKGGLVIPGESRFLCCDGSGMNLDELTNIVTRCNIKWRLNQVQGLLVQLAHTWGVDYVKQLLTEKLSTEEIGWLIELRKGNPCRGFYRVSQRNKAGPSRFWLMALGAVWRFGISAHLVTLRKNNAGGLLPKQNSHSNQQLMFVENIDGLWKPEQLYDFETMISYCDHQMAPLFCEFKIGDLFQNKIASDPKKNDRRSKFTKRIEKKKAQFPLVWLERDMIERFETVCEKVDAKLMR